MVKFRKVFSKEPSYGWGKSSIQEDNIHVLRAINEGLADQLKWPTEERRATFAQIHTGTFRNMIGIIDIREHEIEKSMNLINERMSWSTKHKMNSYKNLSVLHKKVSILQNKCNI